MLGGNPADLSAMAARLSTASESIRDVRGSTTHAAVWQGQAAAAHAIRLADLLHDLFVLETDVDDAAAAVRHLAEVVNDRQQFLIQAWANARDAAEDAADAAAGGAKRAWQYAEDAGGWAKDQLDVVRFW